MAALDLTLFELSEWQRGRADAAREQMVLAGWAAWQTANLGRAKKLPLLKKWMADLRREPKPAGAAKVGDVIAAMRMDALSRGLPPPKQRKWR